MEKDRVIVNEYGRRKLEQFKRISVVVILAALLVLVIVGIFRRETYISPEDPGFFAQETLAIASQDILDQNNIPREITADVYYRIRDFVMSDIEKNTAPHENRPANAMELENYYTATIDSDSFQIVTGIDGSKITFGITVTDGRKYAVIFNLLEEMSILGEFEITRL